MRDYIKREDVLTYIDHILNSGMGKKMSLDYIRKYIEKLPSADVVERKRGEWTPTYKSKLHSRMTCSVCGYDGEDEMYGRISNRIIERFNFCPNCGSGNRGGNNNE